MVLAVFAALILAGDEKDRRAGVYAMLLAGVLLGAGGSALKLLADAGRPAKIATVVTAALAMLAGIALVGTWLSFLLPMIGLGLLFLALLPDDPEAGSDAMSRLLVVQPEVDDPAHLFGEWLTEAGAVSRSATPTQATPYHRRRVRRPPGHGRRDERQRRRRARLGRPGQGADQGSRVRAGAHARDLPRPPADGAPPSAAG